MDYKTVRELFDYREDGKLVWKVKRSGTKRWKTAGCMHRNGYVVVTYKGKQYPAHRLIWLWHHGYLPEKGTEIDHINRHRDDNRIENIRMVSRQCNQRNTGNWATCTTGVKGVSREGVTYRAQIRVSNRLSNLGNYYDFNEAVLARLAAEQCLGWKDCGTCSPAYRYAKQNNLIR